MTQRSLELQMGYDPVWLSEAVALYDAAGLGRKEPAELERALRASLVVVTAWMDCVLCGIGRAIGDGVYYASVFDVAVHPDHQRSGVGSAVMGRIHEALGDIRIYLTSTFGNEAFYRHLGYRRHKTAMARYPPRFAASPYLEKD